MVAYEIAMGFALVGRAHGGGQPEPRRRSCARRQGGLAGRGTGSGCSRCSSCTSSPASPRPTARPSTWPKASRRSSRASTWSTPASRFALFFLAEYANMILISALTAVFFFGGWLSPFAGLSAGPAADTFLAAPSFLLAVASRCSVCVFLFLWFRATFPRYRYDQIMRLGWKVAHSGDARLDRRRRRAGWSPRRSVARPWSTERRHSWPAISSRPSCSASCSRG